MPLFETSVSLACPQEAAFDFLARPANVVLISPPEIGLHFVSAPEIVELGSRLEFKVQGWGQVQCFLHEITALEPKSKITEQQVKGLFGKWLHEHVLSTNAHGETIVTDRIEFEPPTGLLGFLVTKSKILEYLEEGFEHRQEQMKKLLSAGRASV